MPQFHIDEVCVKDEIHPMIVNFQNGYTTDSFKTTNCLLLNNENNGKKTLAAELSGLVYAGEEEEEPLGRTLILAKNRKTGKVRLIEVTCAEMKPVVKLDNPIAQLLETSNLELNRKFGSKRSKKHVEQRERLKVNVQTVTDQLQNVTENITQDKLDLSSYNKSDSDDFYIPPINREADMIEDVYDVHKILTEEQFEDIYSEIEGKDYQADLYPIIKKITSEKNLSKKQTVLALYANCLLKMYMTMSKDIIKKAYVACSVSKMLNDVLCDNFTIFSYQKRTRPIQYKDKALCHAIVFILLVNGYKFDIQDLCDDVKLTVTNAMSKVRVTGAYIVNKQVVQLKLPLNKKIPFRRKSARF